MDPNDRPDRRHWPSAAPSAPCPEAAVGGSGRTRVEEGEAQQARIATLHTRLLSGSSATATLEHWCTENGLSAQARVRALRVHQLRPAPEAVRNALQAPADAWIEYRRVQLICSDRLLSEADNWYLPSRLTPAMIAQLQESDAPFGRVVDALQFQRETLSDHRFWPPKGDAGVVLEVHALLRDQLQRPFSYVVESYLAQILP